MAEQQTPAAHESKPLLFIGSSKEGLEPARAIRNLLDADVQGWLWNEAFFQFGLGFLESLVVRLKTFDFAVLVATPDDETTSRDVSSLSPRDNVIFELGLFMATLGESACSWSTRRGSRSRCRQTWLA